MSALVFPLAEEQGEHLLLRNVGGVSPPTQVSEPRRRIDLRGHPLAACVEHLSSTMPGMARGELLEVVTSDPASVDAVPAWAHGHGHEVLESGGDGHTYRFLLRAG